MKAGCAIALAIGVLIIAAMLRLGSAANRAPSPMSDFPMSVQIDTLTGRACHRCHYDARVDWCRYWDRAPMLDAERFFWLQDPKILFRNVHAYRDYDAWLQNPPPMLAEGREAHKRRTNP